MKHRPWLGAACLLVGMPLTTLAAEDSDLTVQVPSGETRLADLGLYRVGRQSYGKEPAWMPPGWSGHFDDATGISCQSAGRILGREALLLHSPWRVPPGRTWVEYQLTLPTTQPIHFSFGIAMGPDTVASNKSDGVTFSCSLAAAGTDRELMRQHSAKAAWGRLGLDGKPRPTHLDHGLANLQWERTTEWTRRELVNHVEPLAQGDGWREERTGLHAREFIETRRHWFSKSVPHDTGGGVNVLNLVEGEEALVESPTDAFKPFVVHYAESFIVPAAVGRYTIRPHGANCGKDCATLKASVRT